MPENNVDRDLKALESRRTFKNKQREDERYIKNHAHENAKGKLKIKSRTSGPMGRELNHRKPRGNTFIRRNNKVENPMAQFGYTDEEYNEYLKTGKVK